VDVKENHNKFIEQLIASFEKKKCKQKSYSWRELAKQLGFSQAFLSNILKGNKSFPLSRVDLLIQVLDLDGFSKRRLMSSLVETHFEKMKSESENLKEFLDSRDERDEVKPSIFTEIPSDSIDLFHRWYIPVLLDLVPTQHFALDIKWISKTIGISQYEAEWAWNFLIKEELVRQDENDKWIKCSNKLRLSSNQSVKQIRNFYSEMFKKAQSVMSAQTDEASFKRRHIMG
jgi:uncharacterized protein (TIGR02147 family)